MHPLSFDFVNDSAMAPEIQSFPGPNECHGLCNNPSSQVLDPLSLYTQQVLLRRLASAVNRNHRKAKMQDKHRRLQQAKSKMGKRQQVLEGKKLPPYSGNAKKSNEGKPKSPRTGNRLPLTPNFIISNKGAISSKILEVKNRTPGQEIYGTARSRDLPAWLSVEMDQKYRSSPLSSTFQISIPSVLRTTNLPLLEFKSWQKSLTKECSDEQPPDAALATEDAAPPRNAARDDSNATTDDVSLSSVCTSDKESSRQSRVASQSFDLSRNCEEKLVSCGLSNDSRVPQDSPSLTSQPLESCENSNIQADKDGASNFWHQNANEIVFEQVTKADEVDVGDSGSSTSRPLLLQPTNHNQSNEHSAAIPKEFTEYPRNAADTKPLASINDPGEVPPLTLLDILADAAIDASPEASPVCQKFQGVDRISQRQVKRKHSILEERSTALQLAKGLFLHGNVKYAQKRATRRTISILKKIQSSTSENFGLHVQSIWPPLQARDKQAQCIDQTGLTLDQTSKPENIGLANRSNLRRTAGLPVRLRDSVIELQTKNPSRFKPNS